MSIIGVNGQLITIQVDIANGVPSWDVVGLPDVSIKESKQRVRASLKNIGYDIPSRKIVINLAPANIKKEGSFFDLPIAIGIISDLENFNPEMLDEYFLVGELSLDGSINKINGVLPMCIEAYNLGIKKAIIPYENRFEAGIVKDLDIYPAKNLEEVIKHFNGVHQIEKFKLETDIFLKKPHSMLDFSSVKGQEKIKRALEIAASGGHNCLLIGSPGSRKNNACKKDTIHITRFNL